MAEYNKVYASLKPELPKVIQQEQIYVYAPRSSRAGMKNISSFNITSPVAAVLYDTTDGITVIGDSSLVSEEVSGEKLTQNFQSEFSIPVRPGKYINIDADADNNYVVIKVDDTALALDFIKINNKTLNNVVPAWYNGKINWDKIAIGAAAESFAYRDRNGNSSFNNVNVTNDLKDPNNSNYKVSVSQLYFAAVDNSMKIDKTSTDTGTMGIGYYNRLIAYPDTKIEYDGQLYYRMDPTNAPDGTLNFIHIDSIQDGEGGYKATGKCFSITASTRAWKVFDLEFDGSGGSGNYIPINNTSVDTVPVCKNGAVMWTQVTNYSIKNTIVKRDDNNGISCGKLNADSWWNTAEEWDRYVNFDDVYAVCKIQSVVLADTDTVSSGTLSNKDLTRIKTYITNVVTRGTKVYVRMKNYNSTTEPTMQFVCVNIDVTVSIEVVNIDSTTGAWTVETYYPASEDAVPGLAFKAISELSMLESGAAIAGSNTNGYSATGYVDITTKDGSIYEANGKMPIPIIGDGKYLTTSVVTPIEDLPNDQKLKISIDDTALALDYIKIDRTKNSVIPQYDDGKIVWTVVTGAPTGSTIVARNGDGNTYFNKIFVNRLATSAGEYDMPLQAAYYGGFDDGFTVEKTPTNTGTLTAVILDAIRAYPNAGLKYDNQSYIRMDPTNAPDGTLNFIHIDSIQDGEGGYKATGKCFSVTVSTRAWQVVDLNFGNASRTTHNLTITNSSAGTNIYFSLVNNRPETYEGAPAGLLSALENNMIACTVDNGGSYASGIITTDGDNFRAIYGNSEELLMEQPLISITDNVV